jgi:hypothetical protein
MAIQSRGLNDMVTGFGSIQSGENIFLQLLTTDNTTINLSSGSVGFSLNNNEMIMTNTPHTFTVPSGKTVDKLRINTEEFNSSGNTIKFLMDVDPVNFPAGGTYTVTSWKIVFSQT